MGIVFKFVVLIFLFGIMWEITTATEMGNSEFCVIGFISLIIVIIDELFESIDRKVKNK